MNIIIGISWPFANGELHIGHAASSLPGDVIARYHRLKGNNVILVSGTDCHGTAAGDHDHDHEGRTWKLPDLFKS